MNIWRMKLRAGNYGEDIWPACRERGVAAITHPPIYNVDLTRLRKNDVDPEVKTAARTSIWRFAWDVRGGDVIYVGDSKSKSMIARGFVAAEPGHEHTVTTLRTRLLSPAILTLLGGMRFRSNGTMTSFLSTTKTECRDTQSPPSTLLGPTVLSTE